MQLNANPVPSPPAPAQPVPSVEADRERAPQPLARKLRVLTLTGMAVSFLLPIAAWVASFEHTLNWSVLWAVLLVPASCVVLIPFVSALALLELRPSTRSRELACELVAGALLALGGCGLWRLAYPLWLMI